jgi:hypothetical protein
MMAVSWVHCCRSRPVAHLICLLSCCATAIGARKGLENLIACAVTRSCTLNTHATRRICWAR